MIDVDSPEWLGCGVDGHEPECLCDVRISGADYTIPERLTVSDFFMGEEIARLRGYGVGGWTRDEVLDFMEDVLLATDNWSDEALKQMLEAEATEAESSEEKPAYGTITWSRMRNKIRAAMQCNPRPASIADVLREMNVSAEQFIGAATSHKYSFDMEWLLRFERHVLDETSSFTLKELADMMGVTEKVATNLWSYWGVPKRTGRNKPSLVKVRQLLREGVDAREIIGIIRVEYGEDMTVSSVFKTKSRMRQEGELA